MNAIEFREDDGAYLAWLRENTAGYVVNRYRGASSGYLVLHRATCGHISRYRSPGRPGGFTERDYVKVCATRIAPLVEYARRNGRADGSFSKRCAVCDPPPAD